MGRWPRPARWRALRAGAGAEETYQFSIGSSGSGAGQFNEPAGIAVNQATGNVYVADRANNRVQEFSGAGAFIQAWGYDVVASGEDDKPFANEVQKIRVQADGGTFTLEYEGEATAPIAYNASPASVETALNGLAAINGAGSVSVSGGPGDSNGTSPYLVTFDGGSLAGGDRQQLSIDTTQLCAAGRHPAAVHRHLVLGPGRRLLPVPVARQRTADRRRDLGGLHDRPGGRRQGAAVPGRGDLHPVLALAAKLRHEQELHARRLGPLAGAAARPGGDRRTQRALDHGRRQRWRDADLRSGQLERQPEQLHVPVVHAQRPAALTDHDGLDQRRNHAHRSRRASAADIQCKVTATNAGGSSTMWSALTAHRTAASDRGRQRHRTAGLHGDRTERGGAGDDQGERRRRDGGLQGEPALERRLQGRRRGTEPRPVLPAARHRRRQLTRRQRRRLRRGRLQLPGREVHRKRSADPRVRRTCGQTTGDKICTAASGDDCGAGRQVRSKRPRRASSAAGHAPASSAKRPTKTASPNSATRSRSTKRTATSTSPTHTTTTSSRSKAGSRSSTAAATSSARPVPRVFSSEPKPVSIAVDRERRVYVATDGEQAAVNIFEQPEITPEGTQRGFVERHQIHENQNPKEISADPTSDKIWLIDRDANDFERANHVCGEPQETIRRAIVAYDHLGHQLDCTVPQGPGRTAERGGARGDRHRARLRDRADRKQGQGLPAAAGDGARGRAARRSLRSRPKRPSSTARWRPASNRPNTPSNTGPAPARAAPAPRSRARETSTG